MLSISYRVVAVVIFLTIISGCVKSHKHEHKRGEVFYKATGIASWYGKHLKGRATASGEKFDPNALTAAHRTLPFGTMVKVTNLANGRSLMVRINDRGPKSKRRLIDLTHAGAVKLGYIGKGLTRVKIEAYR